MQTCVFCGFIPTNVGTQSWTVVCCWADIHEMWVFYNMYCWGVVIVLTSNPLNVSLVCQLSLHNTSASRIMCGPTALNRSRGHPVFLNPQAGVAVGALSLLQTPLNKSQWLSGSCPAAADRAFPNAGAQRGQTCLHPWALIWFLSLPLSLIHRPGPDEWQHTMRYDGTMALIMSPRPCFFCQPVVVGVKMAADWRVSEGRRCLNEHRSN